jgi:D-alanyl-D-alanine dipeptidase
MKNSKVCFVIIVALFHLASNGECRENGTEMKFIKAGLVEVHLIDESIRVDLVNSDAGKNFFRENYYNGLNKAYLRAEVARKLSLAQKYLKSKYPGYSILIMDAARPRSISRLM